MELEVLIFGAAAMNAKAGRVTVTVGARATVRDVLVALREQHPGLRFALPNPDTGRLAVNQAFARGDHEVKAGDEVALITLLGGG
ncbi:MAG: MoaD/ThiS family protein [Phycisphaerales bacterium]